MSSIRPLVALLTCSLLLISSSAQRVPPPGLNVTDRQTGFITALPESLQPPVLPASFLSQARLEYVQPSSDHRPFPIQYLDIQVSLTSLLFRFNSSTHFPIPSSNSSLSLTIYKSTYLSFPYPAISPLLVDCLLTTATYLNKPDPLRLPPQGLFACSNLYTRPQTYLTFRLVAPVPPVPVRVIYGYLITVLEGLNDWAQKNGRVSGGVMLAAKDKDAEGLVFVMNFDEVQGTRVVDEGL